MSRDVTDDATSSADAGRVRWTNPSDRKNRNCVGQTNPSDTINQQLREKLLRIQATQNSINAQFDVGMRAADDSAHRDAHVLRD